MRIGRLPVVETGSREGVLGVESVSRRLGVDGLAGVRVAVGTGSREGTSGSGFWVGTASVSSP